MRQLLLAGTTAFCMMTAAVPTVEAGVPVIDTAVISNTLQTANNTLQQLQQLTQMREIVAEQLSVLGQVGPGLELIHNSGWAQVAAGGDVLQSLRGHLPDDLLEAAGVTLEVGDQMGVFDDLGLAREAVNKVLFVSPSEVGAGGRLSTDTMESLRSFRGQTLANSAVDGYASAMMARQQLAHVGERAQTLENLVNNAGDLRGDVRAGSAIMLATYHEIAALRATMTSMLELESTRAIAEHGGMVQEGGGTLDEVQAWADSFQSLLPQSGN